MRQSSDSCGSEQATRDTGGRLLAAATLLAAIGVTALDGGGFGAGAQWTFVALAGPALLSAAILEREVLARAAVSPFALTLAALAALSVASSIWTVGGAGAAIRSGLVVAGFATVSLASTALARRAGVWPLATGIVILALVEALLGLYAVALHQLPDAERIAGMWRPGGSFQYAPALALLQVAALPILCSLLTHRVRPLAAAAAAAALLAGAVLGVADSRLAEALAVALLALLIARPSVHAPTRGAAAGTALLAAAGAVVSRILLHAGTGSIGHGSGIASFAAILALGLLAAGMSMLTKALPPLHARRGVVAGTALLICAGVALLTSPSGRNTHRIASRSALLPQRSHHPAARAHRSDWLHGRGHEWEAAVQTWLDRPWLGAGAGAYFTASLRHQGASPSLYAHDLPLEAAAELGAPGLLLALTLYATVCWAVIAARRSPALWLLAPLAIIFLASNLLDWTWHLSGLTALWAAATGALAAAQRKKAISHGPHGPQQA